MTVQLELEVPIGPHKYRVSRMSVFDQMQVASDYRDILVGLALMKRERPKEMDDAEYNKAMQFIMSARGGVTPEARSRVMNLCLSKIVRQSNVGWSPVLAGENIVQFDDISLSDVTALMYAVFEHNKLLDFFSESPSNLGGQKPETGHHSPMEKTG